MVTAQSDFAKRYMAMRMQKTNKVEDRMKTDLQSLFKGLSFNGLTKSPANKFAAKSKSPVSRPRMATASEEEQKFPDLNSPLSTY